MLFALIIVTISLVLSNIWDPFDKAIDFLELETYFSRFATVNETDYFEDFDSCLHSNKTIRCFKLVNKWYRPKFSIWDRKALLSKCSEVLPSKLWSTSRHYGTGGNDIIISKYKANNQIVDTVKHQSCHKWSGNITTDCGYQISFSHSLPQAILVHISQFECSPSIQSVGGASFEVFSSGSNGIAACIFSDVTTSLYTYICPLFNDDHCTNITALLINEHYDNYGEASIEWEASYRADVVLLDGHLICSSPSYSGRRDRAYLDLSSSHLLNYDWFGARWKFSLSENETFFNHVKSIFPGDSRLIDTYSWNRLIDPSSWCNISEYKVLLSSMIPSFNRAFSKLQYPGEATSFDIRLLQKRNQEITETVINLDQIRNLSHLNKKYNSFDQYYFIGASHMRYLFDAVVQRYFGSVCLHGIERQHDDLRIENFHYYPSIYAHGQADYIEKLCRGFNSTSQARTILLQTGDWDLAISSVRRTIHDRRSGVKLINVIKSILNGTIPCMGLSHFVWITSMPHSLCLSSCNPSCSSHQCYRTNSAIMALNQFYLRELLVKNPIDLLKSVHLSIVDAFSIIRPRLLYREMDEVVCLNHFICRAMLHSNKDIYTLFSPGGLALTKSILAALERFQ